MTDAPTDRTGAGPSPRIQRRSVASAASVSSTGGPRIQRLIGFEYELNEWETWKVPADRVDELTALPTGEDRYRIMKDNRAQWQRLPKGAIMLTEGDAEVTADDDGARSDLELRTTALDETNAATVHAAATQIKSTMEEMSAEYVPAMNPPNGHQLRVDDLTGTVVEAGGFFYTNYPNKVAGKVQATAGIDLAHLPDLLRNMWPDPNEGGTERGRRGEGREAMTGYDQDGALPPGPILRVMGAATGKAETAIANFTRKHRNAPAPTAKLKGLVALLIAYMDMGKEGLVRSYSKTIAPVMARTDFATMFAMLSDTERDYYSSGNGDKFVDLLKEGGYDWWSMRKSIYSGGIKESQEPSEWYKDLSRKTWLKDMTAPHTATGTDRLTPQHYPTAEGRRNIEGLGSYANRTDTINTASGPVQVPIIELRSLPKMSPDEFVDFADKLARLVTYLNAGTDKTFGEA